MDRGPLAPTEGESLERRLVESLAKDPRLILVDAAGHPLSDRALDLETQRFRQLVDEGIAHLLNLRYDSAVERLDQAIALFEGQLLGLRDHSRLHDALLGRAEALAEGGHRAAAKTTLLRLAALDPKVEPTDQTHRPTFVTLWREAKRAAGKPGRLTIELEDPGARVQLDGAAIKPPPVTVTIPAGTHYLAARWPDLLVLQSVQVGPNANVRAPITRGTPADQLRRDVVAAAELKLGMTRAGERAEKLAQSAGAKQVLIAAVRTGEGGHELLLARHGGPGDPASFVSIALPDLASEDALRSAIGEAIDALAEEQDGGSHHVEAGGRRRPAVGLPALLYEPGARGALAAASTPSTDASSVEFPIHAPPPDAPGLHERWWFWALIAVAAGGAVTGGLLLARPDPTTTRVELILPGQ
ncbi:MAG: hypothetical protein IT384_11970 [Deltaproteobacteria bacterium]|nr:hypothetical protein [Deltaproteobacteria bacterium]